MKIGLGSDHLDEYGELTEQQKRVMATPSMHDHPEVIQSDP